MPNRNKTGPQGKGPMTGRGMGNCNPNSFSKNSFFGFGRGLGRGFGRGLGRGFGRGLGRGFGRCLGRGFGFNNQPQAFDDIQEKELLAQEVNMLKERLAETENKLKKLEELDEK